MPEKERSVEQERYYSFLEMMHKYFDVSLCDIIVLPDHDLYALIGQKIMEYALSHPEKWKVFEQQLQK